MDTIQFGNYTEKESVEELMQKAVSFHKNGMHTQAEQTYQSILQQNPLHPDANHNMGILALDFGKFDLSFFYLRRAINANPSQGQYWMTFLEALIRSGQIEAAKLQLEECRSKGMSGPAIDAMVMRLAVPAVSEMENLLALFNDNQLDSAEAIAIKMTVECPNHGFGWKVLGAIHHKLGRLEEALNAKKMAVQLMPNDPEVYNNLGYALHEMGDYSDAEASLRRALDLNQNYPSACNTLGLSLEKMGRLDEAEEYFRKAVEIKPDYYEAIKNVGNIFFARKMITEAISWYKQAIAIAPDFESAYNNLGAAHTALGDMDLAVSYYHKAYDINPSSLGTLHNFGSALHNQGKISAAMDCFKQSLAFPANKWVVDSAAYLAVLSYLNNDTQGVIELIENFKGKMGNNDTNMGAYFDYLSLLLESKEAVVADNNDERMYVIGESHALTLHNRVIVHEGKTKTCVSKWIPGCKQWQLGNNKQNRFKWHFKGEMQRIPRGSTVLLTIGEIDCRPNEGILVAWQKNPTKSLNEIIETTVKGYILYVKDIAEKYEHRIIISGVPATNIPLDSLEAKTAEYLVQIIKVFNEILKEETLSAGMNFLDVYTLTDQGDGTASGEYHIDDVHLTPSAMAEAFKKKLYAR